MSKKYTIGQAAEKLHTTPRTLRFYESKGLIEPQKSGENGYRIYSDREIGDLQVVLYLRSLGFSVQKITQLLNEKNSSQSLELLISQEIATNKDKIANLKVKQKKLIDLKEALHKRKLDKDKISDITTIMRNNTQLTKIRRKMIYCGLGILGIEIIGIILIANIMLHHYIFLGEILAMALVVILLVLSTLLARKYYSFVAYVCPSCGTEFKPSFKRFLFSAHTPRFRKLHCPHCDKKSYCLEVSR